MTKLKLWKWLIAKVPGVQGYSNKLKNNKPNIWNAVNVALGKNFTNEALYLYLTNSKKQFCVNPNCNTAVNFGSMRSGYNKKVYCSKSCAGLDPKHQEKRRNLVLKRSNGKYTHHAQYPEKRKASRELRATPEFKENFRNAELIRSDGLYEHHAQRPGAGTKIHEGRRKAELKRSNGSRTHANQRKDVRDKLSKTHSLPEVSSRKVASYVKNELKRSEGKYTNTSQRPDVRSKISKTVKDADYRKALEARELKRSNGKYTNVAQRPEVHLKIVRSAFNHYIINYKEREWNLQGYEDVALRWFTDACNIPINAISNNCKTFSYSVDGKNKMYLPDFKIRYESKLLYVEIKSTYTVNGMDSNELQLGHNELAKAKAITLQHDKPYLLLVFDKVKGHKGEIPRDGKLVGYVLASTKRPNFRIHTNTNWIKKMLKTKFTWTSLEVTK